MNLFSVLLFACVAQTIQSYECIAGHRSYLETLERRGRVNAQKDITLQCKKGKIIKVWTEPVKANRKHGSYLDGARGHQNKATLKITAVRRLWYRCDTGGRREGKAVFVYGNKRLPDVRRDCPDKMRVLINILDPMNYDRFDGTEASIQNLCIGESKCTIQKGSEVTESKYRIETDCRDENYALHCCDSEESKDSENNRATNACNVKLQCECCSRNRGDEKLNIGFCSTKRWLASGRVNLVGINYESGIAYTQSNDAQATDVNPDFDEDGCHVRKALLKIGDGKYKEVCIPGNMARILSVIDIFSEQHDGKCVVRSSKNDESCTKDVDSAKEYFFGVNVLLPPSTDLSTVPDFEDALNTKLQEEELEATFIIKDGSIKARTNNNGVEFLSFVLAISL